MPFHTVHGVLKARILKWLAIPFSSGPHSVRLLHHDPPVLGCPADMAQFHWVKQGCGSSVTRLTSLLWVWFQCVCPLMPSWNTYHLTWVSPNLGVGYLFTAAPAKHSRCSLPWTRGISIIITPYIFFSLTDHRYTIYFVVFNSNNSIDKFRFNLMSEPKNTAMRVELQNITSALKGTVYAWPCVNLRHQIDF